MVTYELEEGGVNPTGIHVTVLLMPSGQNWVGWAGGLSGLQPSILSQLSMGLPLKHPYHVLKISYKPHQIHKFFLENNL